MKTQSTPRWFTAICLLQSAFSHVALAQPSNFTYQGVLTEAGAPANGIYDFQFEIHAASASGAPVQTSDASDVPVVNGLFTAEIPATPAIMDGAQRWLSIKVRTNGVGGYTQLAPRTEVTPTPYAVRALNVSSNALMGEYGEAVSFPNPANAFVGDGSGLTGVTLDGATADDFWQMGGNAGTTPGTQFIGTTDNQALEFKVNSQRALRVESTGATPSLIGGFSGNSVGVGTEGAVIAGGGSSVGANSIGGNSDYTVISGGERNTIGEGSWWASIVAGYSNNIGINTDSSFIGGGALNRIADGVGQSTIGAGEENTIGSGSVGVTIAGGRFNTIGANSFHTVMGGGYFNRIDSNSVAGTIAGGGANVIGVGSISSTIGGGTANNLGSGASFVTLAGGISNTIASSSESSVIGGGRGNFISDNAQHATISGGSGHVIGTNSSYSFIGGGLNNSVESNVWYATIAGGSSSSIASNSWYGVIGGGEDHSIGISSGRAVIGGGAENNIAANSPFTTIAGGENNQIGAASQHASIMGGLGNSIGGDAWGASITGGSDNSIGIESDYSTVCGGRGNQIADEASYSTIVGGRSNNVTADAFYALAAGYRANASDPGTFVWADSTEADFESDRANQFKVRAGGGVYLQAGSAGLNPAALRVECIGTTGVAIHANQTSSDSTTVFANRGTGHLIRCFSGPTASSLVFRVQNDGDVGLGISPSHPIHHSSGAHLTAAGVWTSVSDRNAKQDFAQIDPLEVLDKVIALPVSQWRYRLESEAVKHIGPMAQDFHTAFGLGESETSITSVDADGVALAAIQGLNQKLESGEQKTETRMERLEAENVLLRQELQEIKQLLLNQFQKGMNL